MATGLLVAPAVLLTSAHVIPTLELGTQAHAEIDYQDGLDGRLLTPTVVPCDPVARAGEPVSQRVAAKTTAS
jgi:hypothetical protein